MMQTQVLLSLSFLMVLASPGALAAPASASLSFVSGDVQIGQAKHFVNAKMNDVVHEGDSVRTGTGALAVLRMEDQSLLKLKEKTEVVLGSSAKGEILLNAGGAFANVTKANRKHFVIRTKSAVMGVRGTQFFTSYGDPGKHAGDVWMCVKEGVVAVETQGKPEVLVKEGLGVFIPTGKPVTEPKPYAWTEGLNWNMDPKKGELTDHSDIKSSYRDLLDQSYD